MSHTSVRPHVPLQQAWAVKGLPTDGAGEHGLLSWAPGENIDWFAAFSLAFDCDYYGTTLSLHSTSQGHLCGESVVGERAYDGWVARGSQAWRKRRKTRSVGWGWKSGGWYLSHLLGSPLLQPRQPGKRWLMVVCFCYHTIWEQCTDGICQCLDNFYGLDCFINQNIMEQKNVFRCPDHYRWLHFNFVKMHVVKPQKSKNNENTKKHKKYQY